MTETRKCEVPGCSAEAVGALPEHLGDGVFEDVYLCEKHGAAWIGPDWDTEEAMREQEEAEERQRWIDAYRQFIEAADRLDRVVGRRLMRAELTILLKDRYPAPRQADGRRVKTGGAKADRTRRAQIIKEYRAAPKRGGQAVLDKYGVTRSEWNHWMEDEKAEAAWREAANRALAEYAKSRSSGDAAD